MAAPPERDGPANAEFDRLYAAHSREVWAVAYARTLDSHLALDALHESFLRLWKAWEAGETIEQPRAWLFRVCRNLAEDWNKNAFRKHGTRDPEQLRSLPGRAGEPDAELARIELNATIRRELERLSDADRELLTLRYALEYTTEQITQVLGINATALHMRLSRARQRLAERLLAQGVEPP